MNDVVLLGCLFVVMLFLIAGLGFYNVYRGVHDSLTNAVIGTVYNFRYFQPLKGEYERYLARVVEIRKLTDREIARLNWGSDYRVFDKNFKRSPTLVTCEMSNGDYRQFYAERSDMCKRSAIGGLLFRSGFAHLF
jgi:hypothetical protein